MENKDYMSLIKNQIEHDKLLNSVKPEFKEQAEKLFNKKNEIIEKNSFFANWQLKKINKKINKLKNK